ncbi:MAG: cysteine desulfurase [Phycisphaerales bacterium]|nr:cysteine desulfurase [Phycisphaerales bacterium]
MPAYLDNNATTQPTAEVVRAVADMLTDRWQNPSSVHRGGQAARHAIELARESVARLVGARPREIVFTSGATESIDLAIRGVVAARMLARPGQPVSIVTTDVEHEAVRDACADLAEERSVQVRRLPINPDGRVDASALPALLDAGTALVSVQWANNETGAVQPVADIAAACRAANVPFHCDGTQWAGKMPTDLAGAPDLGGGIDLLSFSAHKLHGPKGVGALFIRRGVRLRPRIRGTQELERRGGTENAPAIAGFGVAADQARAWLADPARRQEAAARRDRFEARVLAAVPDASVNGPRQPALRLWNTTNIAFPRLEAEALLLLLSEQGVAASAGAACSSGSLDPSPVLLAMGVPPERAHGSLRFSLSRTTTDAEIDEAADTVDRCVARLRASAPAVR